MVSHVRRIAQILCVLLYASHRPYIAANTFRLCGNSPPTQHEGGTNERKANGASVGVPRKFVGMSFLKTSGSWKHRNTRKADMTLGRRVARFLTKFSWYYPCAQRRALHDEAAVVGSSNPGAWEPPSLDRAWEYFEYFTLPRRLVGSSEGDFKIARIGQGNQDDEIVTELFPIWDTPESGTF